MPRQQDREQSVDSQLNSATQNRTRAHPLSKAAQHPFDTRNSGEENSPAEHRTRAIIISYSCDIIPLPVVLRAQKLPVCTLDIRKRIWHAPFTRTCTRCSRLCAYVGFIAHHALHSIYTKPFALHHPKTQLMPTIGQPRYNQRRRFLGDDKKLVPLQHISNIFYVYPVQRHWETGSPIQMQS